MYRERPDPQSGHRSFWLCTCEITPLNFLTGVGWGDNGFLGGGRAALNSPGRVKITLGTRGYTWGAGSVSFKRRVVCDLGAREIRVTEISFVLPSVELWRP